tara:strand:+ start:758 stop:1705 length:948 start_codon:yes stop_codon:yes gene_type:complete
MEFNNIIIFIIFNIIKMDCNNKNKTLRYFFRILTIFFIVCIIISLIAYIAYNILKKNIDERFKNSCNNDNSVLNFEEFKNKDHIETYAIHANNIYVENCRNGLIHDHLGHWQLIKLIKLKNDNIIGYIIKSSQTNDVVLSFRGSASSFDLLSGIKISQKSIPFAEGKVHKGFYNYYVKFRKQILDSLDKIKFQNIYMTGHSMGGIFAILCSIDIFKRYSNCNVNTVVFGTPKIGNDKFSNYLGILNKDSRYNLTLVANDNDIITQIPSTNYFHPNVVYKKFYIDYGNITQNHSINNYNNTHVLNSLNNVNVRNIS